MYNSVSTDDDAKVRKYSNFPLVFSSSTQTGIFVRLDIEELTGWYLFKEFNILVKAKIEIDLDGGRITSIQEVMLPEGIHLITDGLNPQDRDLTTSDSDR